MFKIIRENAQGIAYKGTVYNLKGRDGIDSKDTVFLIEVDSGVEMMGV